MLLFDETELFDEGVKRYTDFALPDAELRLWEQFFPQKKAALYFKELLYSTPWQQRSRNMYDKIVLDPRLTAYYGGSNGLPWTDILKEIKLQVEAETGIVFNRV